MNLIALLICILLNGGGDTIQSPVYEDTPIVGVMASLAVAALVESHPECDAPTWDYNVDASDGITVHAHSATCEFAAEFYRAPDTLRWQFAIEGA